ncbi:hypothetical protein ORJ04_10045 [Rheinheimera baltica]|uniref:Uncharacterized protein n=1 Tax=Rheinheimera baltica TaxID=67576 RepID=A0ABT9HYV1_9GAMM|nr:hypothetical protein [Rheinheimera baltica]MDP5136289.1 hypothetical protein [Rheinheimera baltica]
MRENIVEEEFSKIISVDFEMVEDCLLRKGAWTKETFLSWKETLGNDNSRIEKVINHYHLRQLFWFVNGHLDTTLDEMIEIGRFLKSSWMAKLDQQFPTLNIVVEFDERFPEDGYLDDLNVTVFIDRYA